MIATTFLHQSDYHLYGSWLKQQDIETLQLYFGVTVTAGYIDRLMERIVQNPEKHRFLVAFNHDRWLGVVHIADAPDSGAEFGFIVSKSFRGQGIADRLMDEAVTWCRNRRYQKLCLHCLSWNEPVKKLCRKHGLEIHRNNGDADVEVDLPPPSVFSIGKEISSVQRNLFTMMLDRTLNPTQ
jgi:RimJ/RimL family protein N-acetyltransferase